jgi:predicted hydrocarbon binding protein
MEVVYFGECSGEVILTKSHVDAGWLKKWGKYDAPVNYIAAGYIAGMFSAACDMPVKTYNVTESESIAMGAELSRFRALKK